MEKHNYILLILIITIVANGFSQRTHSLIFQNENFDATWIYPGTIKEVGKYEKIELSIKLKESIRVEIAKFLKKNSEGLNPFNPEDISLEAKFISPSKKGKVVYGFYYEDYNRSSDSWKKKNTTTK